MAYGPPDFQIATAHRLRVREQIRANNSVRPRCSGCGNDMPLHAPDDMVTAEQFDAPGYEYLRACDFRPGDLICFWCIAEMMEFGGRFPWGHA